MVTLYKFWKDKFNLPTIIMIVAVFIGFFHFFSYFFPFTDDAFVVSNTQTVAADVSGYITKIYVNNGQRVTKGSPLFQVFATPYRLAYQKAKAEYEEAIAGIAVLEEEAKKDKSLLAAIQSTQAKIAYEYKLKKNSSLDRSVSRLEVQQLEYDITTLTHQGQALESQLAMNAKQKIQQEKKIKALKAEKNNRKVMLDLTCVRAGANGIVDNMYLAVGTPVTARTPLFSFINTDQWYVQANFNETDLRYVRPGNKVTIILRMYYFKRIFHGEIVNQIWAVNRQKTALRNQQQIVINNNQWLNLPQRFPLQIKITDPDPNYPLNPGASAYVYIKT